MAFLRSCSGRHLGVLSSLALVGSLAAMPASADSGFYVGGSVGLASLQADIDDIDFDENDTAYKLFGGYALDLPILELGFEGGYVDFGKPSGSGVDIDATGLDAFVVGAFDFSVIGIFAKVGVVSWDADIQIGPFTGSDDGTDSAYGLGLRFDVRNLSLRAEYEVFDIEDTDDLDMFSVGVIWYFNRT